jgi:8-oxo-dGTP diphosphatase
MHDIVAALLVRGNRVLLGRRAPGREWFPDVWDLPGGHVEAGEDAIDALAREIEEELGVAIARPVSSPFATAEQADLRLRIWLVRDWTGEPRNVQPAEHSEIGWFGTAEIPKLDLADPAYVAIIERALLSE